MVGAATRLIDCWEPQVEWMRLPGMRWPSWRAVASVSDRHLDAVKHRSLTRVWRRAPAPVVIDGDVIGLDLRSVGGSNIAHAMISGIVRYSVASRALVEAGISSRLIAVLPAYVAPFVRSLFALFEVPFINTDAVVAGQLLELPLLAHQEIQLAAESVPSRLNELLASRQSEFPTKVFLARRGSRALLNMADVESITVDQGYVTVYPERLSVLDQLRLLWQAEDVVAVHGAALGLLLARSVQRDRRPLRLVEVFGPGYVVSLYRCLAASLNAQWIGVRGCITPEAVRDLDQTGQANWRYKISEAVRGFVPGRWLPPDGAWQRSHQRSQFEVDQQSLSLAMEMVRDPERALPERVL